MCTFNGILLYGEVQIWWKVEFCRNLCIEYSVQWALSISSKYDNIVSFISKIKSEENSLNFISTIILSNGNKLGVKSAEKIIKFLGI